MPEFHNTPTALRSGTFAHLVGLLNGTAQYISARLSLIGVEAKDAGLLYGIAAAMVAGALFVAVLGYIFLIITAVFGIAAAFDAKHAWIIVLGVAAVLHFGGAFLLVFLARQRVKAGAFPSTIEELKKDRTWLSTVIRTP